MFPVTEIYTVDRHVMAAYSFIMKEKEYRKFSDKFAVDAADSSQSVSSRSVSLDLSRKYSKLAGYCHELAKNEIVLVRPAEVMELPAKAVLSMPEFKQIQDELDPFMLGDSHE